MADQSGSATWAGCNALAAGRDPAQILELVGEYCQAAFPAQAFLPGQSPVPVAGRVFDDRRSLATWSMPALDFWLTTGRFADQFERDFARVLRRRVTPCSSTPVRRPTWWPCRA